MTVPRTVQFWQITNPRTDNPLPGVFPAGELSRKLKKAGVAASLWEAQDGWRIEGEGRRDRPPAHLVLYRIRHDGLPHIEQRGRFSDLQLAADQNLAEATHFRFFERNVVGMLYNNDGPQASRLVQYLHGHLNVDINLVPVLRRDVAKTLDRMEELTVVELGIPVDRAHLLEDDGSDAIRALKEMAEVSASKTVYARFSLRGARTPGAGPQWLETIKDIVRSQRLGAFKKLRIRALDVDMRERVWLDLVAEHLTLSEEVEMTSDVGRAVRPASAAQAIEGAYSTLQQDINASVASIRQSNPPLRLRDLVPSRE